MLMLPAFGHRERNTKHSDNTTGEWNKVKRKRGNLYWALTSPPFMVDGMSSAAAANLPSASLRPVPSSAAPRTFRVDHTALGVLKRCFITSQRILSSIQLTMNCHSTFFYPSVFLCMVLRMPCVSSSGRSASRNTPLP
jgi:hypothetical protein